MNWHPINTAPKDGTAVLTEEGFVVWSKRLRYGNPVGWIACDAQGDPFKCVEEGPWEMSPKWWTVLPPTPKPFL